MKDNSAKKVYIVITVALLIISISASLYMLKFKKAPLISDSGTNIEDIEDLIETPNNPTDDSDTSSEEKPSVKIYTNGYDCVLDALSVFDNCKGYKVTSNFTAECDFITQTVTEHIYESGDFYFKESIQKSSNSLGANQYKYIYTTDGGKNVEIKQTPSLINNVPDWSKKQIDKVTTKQDVLLNFDMLSFDTFFLRPTRKSTLIKFDRTSNSKYYIISFQLSKNQIPDKYTKSAIHEGGLESISINSLKLTYYIEKSTLYIRKVERNEKYTAKKSVVTVDMDVYQEFIMNSIDTIIAPQKPSYC